MYHSHSFCKICLREFQVPPALQRGRHPGRTLRRGRPTEEGFFGTRLSVQSILMITRLRHDDADHDHDLDHDDDYL